MFKDVGTLPKIEELLYSRFSFLYGEKRALECLERLRSLFSYYGLSVEKSSEARKKWDEKDTILVTYGDVIKAENRDGKGLHLLEDFLDTFLHDAISTVHILPFFPSSSDAGFSVIDYKKVREELGSWEDIHRLAGKYRLMADLVINHVSRFSQWFKNYEQGKSPGIDYFIEVDPENDLSGVMRPRSSPLLSTVETDRGLRYLWTTFSEDQIDLDFTNPDVLFEFIDIFLFYYSKGIKVIRLDAIPYLWKKIGTTSIHLEETHQIVKLFRDLAECIDPDITLITETNVPFEENISYFGDRDEAHMIYQFSLPPLLLHAILTENAHYLTNWASALPELPEECLYFNFTASHDGIGVRPLEGLIPDKELNYLVESMKEKGGLVSYKTDANGHQSPYELNITYFDAFEEPGHPRTDLQIKRYKCSQIIMLSLQGVPGIYFHNLAATKNNLEGVLQTGHKRDINRKQWGREELMEALENSGGTTHRIFNWYTQVLKKRAEHTAFHPEGEQKILSLGDKVFSFLRTAPDGNEQILLVSNVSGEAVELQGRDFNIDFNLQENRDILTEQAVVENGKMLLEPFQAVWLEV